MVGNGPEEAQSCAGSRTGHQVAHFISLLVFILAGCMSYESAYEEAVYDEEPIYCYQSLAAVDCYRKPDRRSDSRLVNYYGPAPGRTRPPKLQPAIELQAPPGEAGQADQPLVQPAAADEQTRSADDANSADDWKDWLPLISLGFGALQVVAAFVL
jgi:hypothetical protein